MMMPRLFTTIGLAACACAVLGAATLRQDTQTPPPATEPKEQPVEYVLLTTSKGEILLELNREKAPQTVKNFLQYVKDEHYDGTIFHRVIKEFMIQGGGMLRSMAQKPTRSPIKIESGNGLKNERGTVAMARTSDPNSATSQFFINVVDNAFLNKEESQDGHGYAVFGKVVAGMDVVDAIRNVRTTRVGQHENVPVEPVELTKAEHVSEEAAKKKIEDAKTG